MTNFWGKSVVVLPALALLSFGFGLGSAAHAAKTKNKSHQDLCSADFNLKVKVEPAPLTGSTSPTPSEIEIVFSGSKKQGQAFRHDTDEKGILTAERCNTWGPLALRWLDQARLESGSRERRGVVCVNVATVVFAQKGRAPETSRICLADAGKDSASTAFKHFYDQTDALVSAAIGGSQ